MATRKKTKPEDALPLPSFEGSRVVGSQVRITKAGDGLSEALKMAPEALEIDDEVRYVIRAVCVGVNHKKEPKTGTVWRVHTVEVESIAPIDADLADKVLAEAADRLDEAKAKAAGQDRIPTPPEPEHTAGEPEDGWPGE